MEKGHKADATECRKIAKQLQGYAWMLHKRGDWVDKKYLNLKEREKACLEIMNQREVELAQARQAHEQALKELRDMQARRLEFSLCVWMEQTEDALAEILDAFAESIGNVRKMAGVCQRFIAFFADSSRWRPLYEFSADGEEHFAFPGKEFHMFQDRIFRVWQCLISFVAVEEAEKAFEALVELLGSWLSLLFFESQGRDVKFRRRVGRRREKFARTLAAMGGRLQDPKAFFTLQDDVAAEAGPVPEPQPTPKRVMKKAVLLDANRDISRHGYTVDGDRKTIRFAGKSYRLTAPKVVRKVNEMIKTLYKGGTDAYVPFVAQDSNQFQREPYESFLADCIRRKVKPGSDPDSPLYMQEARLRVAGED